MADATTSARAHPERTPVGAAAPLSGRRPLRAQAPETGSDGPEW